MANSTASIHISPHELSAAAQGWQLCQYDPNAARRLILATQAREKCGKTHMGFTMPGPIAFLNLDRGWEGVLDKFTRAGKVIVRKDFVINPAARMSDNDWDVLWDQLRASFVYAVTSGKFRSVLVDTGSAFWEAMRMAAFGKLAQVPPLKYAELNQQFEALLAIAYNYPVNVCFAHRMKEVYANDSGGRGNKTGAWEPTGYKDIKYVVQVNIEQAWNPQTNVPALRIESCRFNQRLAGAVLEGPMCNFPALAMLIHGADTAQCWADGSREVV